ncbi:MULTISPECIES: hypothetical protein [Arthrobacter]|uniref:PknH-like extracellular domain-containing protein n=1 Tax=Arthrobacter terricola TaxID=2547396 RepID=A0A4R5KZ34_9MICC|nr:MULTISPECIES: hypothetical protein [Arthrobacter]MBT8160143.1 hypothetical protein [Arthrobacter sp. GN70]TDG01137.1 hypothetical protein E1809_03695 [Arthrobacter terricola]
MNRSILGIIGISAVLATGVTACGASGNSTAAGASESAAPIVLSQTPTPTPTPTQAKKYTSDELAGLLGQLHDSKGAKLSVLSSADLSGTVDQTKSILSSIAVEPAECGAMAAAGMAQSVAGASMALGTSTDTASGTATTISLMSGLDAGFLQQSVAQTTQLDRCASMSMTVSGVRVDVAISKVDGVGSVPDTVAYRTDTTFPGGRKQSVITAQAVKGAVRISSIATVGSSEQDAVSRAGALLDQADALVK